MKTQSKRYLCATSGLTRRNLLKVLAGGLGASVAGMAAEGNGPHPRPIPAPGGSLGSSANAMWTDPINVGNYTNGLYVNGIVHVAGLDGVGAGTYAFTDIQSGPGTSSGIDGLPILGQLVSVNGQIFAPCQANSQGNAIVFAVGPVSTLLNYYYLTAPSPVSNQVSLGNILVYVSSDGNLVGITPVPSTDPNTGNPTFIVQTAWTVSLGLGSVDSAAIDILGTSIIVATNNGQVAVRLLNGQPAVIWTKQLGGLPQTVTLANNFAYIVTSDSFQIIAMSMSDGSSPWTYTGKANLGPCLNFNGNVYVGDQQGNLNILNQNTGMPIGNPVALREAVDGSNLFIEDGIAYTSSAAGTVFAIDTTDPYSNARPTFAGAPGAGGALVGVENGICFILTGNGTISGVDMVSLVHGFACESTLQADTVAAASSGYIPSSPVFHTVVQLVDPSKNPRVNISVKVWASDTLTISDGVSNYNVDPNTTAWLQTDSAGYLNITSTASDISSPALYLWSSFMDRAETILIYPDQDVVNTLPSKSAGVASAQNYAGDTILQSGVKVSDVTAVVANTMGGSTTGVVAASLQRMSSQRSVGRARRSATFLASAATSSYFAFPASTTNMGYANAALQPSTTSRAFNAANANSFTYPSDSATALASAAHAEQLLGLSWSDFKAKIVHGANIIKSIACTVDKDLNQAVHTIYDDAGNLYKLTVNYVEDAITVVSGFIKSVVKDLESAIEWLSTVLDWKGILTLQQQLVAQVNSSISSVQAWVALQKSLKYGPVNSGFETLKNDFTQFVGTVNGAIGGQSLGNMQQNYASGNDPKAVFGHSGAKSYGPGSSMMAKVKNNIGSSQNVSTAFGATKLSSLNTGPLGPMITLVFNLVDGIKSDLASSLPQIETDLVNFFENFANLYKKPVKFLENGISDILSLLGDLLNLLLSAIETVIDSILDLLAGSNSLLSYLSTYLNNAIHIPVVSDLWNLISGGEPLTILNLACLLIAIPTKIVSDVVGGASKTVMGVGGSLQIWQTIGSAVSGIFGGIIDALCDGLNVDANEAIAGLDIACASIALLLNLPSDFSQNQAGTYVMWCLGLVPIGVSLMSAATFETGSLPVEDPNYDPLNALWKNTLAPYALTGFGIIMFFSSIGFGVMDPNTGWGPKGIKGPPITLIQNVFSAVDYIPKALSTGDATCHTVLAISDAIWPLGSAICNVIGALS